MITLNNIAVQLKLTQWIDRIPFYHSSDEIAQQMEKMDSNCNTEPNYLVLSATEKDIINKLRLKPKTVLDLTEYEQKIIEDFRSDEVFCFDLLDDEKKTILAHRENSNSLTLNDEERQFINDYRSAKQNYFFLSENEKQIIRQNREQNIITLHDENATYV